MMLMLIWIIRNQRCWAGVVRISDVMCFNDIGSIPM